MADINTEININLLADSFRREAKKLVDETNRTLNRIDFKSTITSISAGFNIAKVAAQAVGAAYKATVGEAIEAEKAVRKLAQSMRLVGDFSEDAVQEFENFSKALESTTGVSGEAVLAAASLAKNYRLTNKEAQLAVRAALELSAATGRDLNSAVSEVSKTFSGFIGKDLAKLLPGLKGLTKEQLVAGEAARLLEERFRGSAAALGDSAEGNLQKFRTTLGDIAKDIGSIFLPAVNKSLKALSNFASDQATFFNRDFNLQRLFDTGGIDAFARIGEQNFQNKDAKAAERAAKDFAEKQLQDSIRRQRELDAAREKSEIEFQGIKKDLEITGLTGIAKIQKDFDEKRKVVLEAIRTGVIRSEADKIRYLGNLELEEAKRIAEERKRLNEEVARDGVAAFIRANAEGRKLTAEQGNLAVLSSASNFTQGEQGARQLIAQTSGAAANAVLPGSGPIVEKIVDTLGQGPEKVKQTVEEFVRGIPTVITNIIKSLPQLAISIIREIPKAFVTFIKEGIPDFISALIDAIPVIIEESIKSFPRLIGGLIDAIITAIPAIVQSFASALVNAAGDFVNALVEAITDVGGFLENVGGGIGDFFGGIGDFLGFAEGGRVPNKAAYEGDRFPARLNAGEQVLSKDLSASLEEYLSGQSGGGRPTTIVIQVGQRELANVILDLNTRGFRTA